MCLQHTRNKWRGAGCARRCATCWARRASATSTCRPRSPGRCSRPGRRTGARVWRGNGGIHYFTFLQHIEVLNHIFFSSRHSRNSLVLRHFVPHSPQFSRHCVLTELKAVLLPLHQGKETKILINNNPIPQVGIDTATVAFIRRVYTFKQF